MNIEAMTSQSDQNEYKKIQIPEAEARLLKERWLLFFESRLFVGPQGLEQWRQNLKAVAEELFYAPLSVLIDEQKLSDALDLSLSSEPIQKAFRPIAKTALLALRAEFQGRRAKLSDYIPETSKRQIDQLLHRPDLFPEKLMRQIAMHEASEEIMRDVLYDTLKEFSEKVNPFFAEWGLPALLKKVSPFGLGAFQKSLESMKGDFDKRLEPEIRKFLQGFSKKGLSMTVEKIIAKSGEPKAIALRKSIFSWLLAQEIAQLASSLQKEDAELFNSIGLDIGEYILSLEEVKARRRALLSEFFKTQGHKNLNDLCSEFGVLRDKNAETAFWDGAAQASFPLLKAALSSPSAKRWMAEMVDAFFEENINALPQGL